MKACANDALSIAHAAGLDIRTKGSRSWSCCPLHGEKTPSLCFFPDGRWHCFGCGAGGDAADLYAALYKVTLGEALRAVRGDGYHKRQPTKAELAQRLRRKVENWKAKQWAEVYQRYNTARLERQTLEQQNPPDALEANARFWELLQQEAIAQDQLHLLETATPRQLLHLMGGTP